MQVFVSHQWGLDYNVLFPKSAHRCGDLGQSERGSGWAGKENSRKRVSKEPEDNPGGRDTVCWLTGPEWACMPLAQGEMESLTDQRPQGLGQE